MPAVHIKSRINTVVKTVDKILLITQGYLLILVFRRELRGLLLALALDEWRIDGLISAYFFHLLWSWYGLKLVKFLDQLSIVAVIQC